MDYSRETEGIIEAVGGAPVIIKLLGERKAWRCIGRK